MCVLCVWVMTLEITDHGNYFLDGCGFAAWGIFFGITPCQTFLNVYGIQAPGGVEKLGKQNTSSHFGYGRLGGFCSKLMVSCIKLFIRFYHALLI